MPSISLLLASVKKDYPQFQYVQDELCRWSPENKTIYFRPLTHTDEAAVFLHELAHGILDHQNYDYDIDLIKIERQAWDYARETLAAAYGTTVSDDIADEAIESYRSWLHSRSTCPNCSQTGLQTKNDTYQCLNCRCRWRVNDARQCGLKRYTLSIASIK